MALRSDRRRVRAGGGWQQRVGLVVYHFLHLFLLVATPIRLDAGRWFLPSFGAGLLRWSFPVACVRFHLPLGGCSRHHFEWLDSNEVLGSKSPKGGVNRQIWNLQTLSTTTRRVSVRNITESERVGENKSTKEIERMTRWFVLARFGSCKPTLRWGGHKDRVSFNPFPLSNGHLDRVSFSPQSNGSFRPRKDHHTIGVSCFDYKCLGNKNGEEEKRSKRQELKWTRKYLSH
jgi:hypothetical protein